MAKFIDLYSRSVSGLRVVSKFPLWLLVVSLVLLYANLCRLVVLPQTTQQIVSATPLLHATTQLPISRPTAQPSTATSAKAVTATALNTPTPAAPNCSPASYNLPSALAVSTTEPGLTQQIDQPTYYSIYGYTAAQVDAQVARCAPSTATSGSGAEFSAETGYQLSWSYRYIYNDDGSCSASDVRVGLHVNMILPAWQSSPYAARGLSTSWQQFRANLVTHEEGHVAIDQQYAASLLSTLQQVAGVDCANISAQLSSITAHGVEALDQANDQYDAQTNHGAAQGAILP